MGCSCDKNTNCDNGTICTCGIVVKFIESDTGVVAEELEGTGYIDDDGSVVYQVEQSPALFNPGLLNIVYRDAQSSWIMEYREPDNSADPVTVAQYSSDALCPDSKCGWLSDCGYYEIDGSALAPSIFSWEGLYSPAPYSDKKAYYFTASTPSGGTGNWYLWYGTNPIMVQNNGPNPRYILASTNLTLEQIEANPELLESVDDGNGINIIGWLEFGLAECADGVFVNYNPGGSPPRIELIRRDALEGYNIEVERVECGCCDKEISVSIKLNDEVESNFIAAVSTDEHGNVIGHNGLQYYTFNDGSRDLFIYFNGTSWAVGGNFTEEIYSSSLGGDCPYAFYTKLPYEGAGDPFKIIQIKGVECFDCCDYYTPRFTNFIRKQRAILVDETSYIRSKEVFGLQCGGDWQDIFRKHLIIDTLSCLPYGVLCEEQEECLIENLSKNCNC